MKHSVRYIQVNYFPSGKGKNIQIIRGMEMREYKYSQQRCNAVSFYTPRLQWEDEFHPNHISFSRIYPKD